MLWEAATEASRVPVLLDLARKAAALRPDVPQNWETLARLLLRSGRNEEAGAVLTEATSRLPDDPKLHLMLADAWLRAGQFELFREVLQRVPPVPASDRELTV